MKIALVNYRYFFSGGPEKYLFNIKEILENNGHEVVPFSVKHNNNVKSEYEKYFLSPMGDGSEVYFGEYNKKSLKDSVKGFSRMIYSFEAKRTFKTFLKETKPDIIYILYFQNKISCSIIDAAHSLDIPIVQRISDFSLLCASNILYRYDKNEICELCLNKSKLNAIKYKCVYNSSLYSFVKVLALEVQRFLKVKDKIDAFVYPSKFTMSKFVEAGYSQKKLNFVPTLFNNKTLRSDLNITYGDFALYIGRIDPDKGLLTLLDAFINTNKKLKIIGFSSSNYEQVLYDHLKGKKHSIEFLGKMKFDQMQEYLSSCLFTIIPSEWYDNLPNTLLESFSMKKCVVATDIGSLSENIVDNQNGLLFEYKDAMSLQEKAAYLFSNPQSAIRLGLNAHTSLNSKFGMQDHYNKLISIFNKLVYAAKNNQ